MKAKQLGISTLGIVLLVIIVVLLLGTYPAFPHAAGWGYTPMGVVGVLAIIVIVLLIAGIL